jgi:hypothetical protein
MPDRSKKFLLLILYIWKFSLKETVPTDLLLDLFFFFKFFFASSLILFTLFATSGKFTSGVLYTCGSLLPVSLTPVANLPPPPESTAGVVDTSVAP